MMKGALVIFLLVCGTICLGNTEHETDSLHNLAKTSLDKTIRARSLFSLTGAMLNHDADSALVLCKQAIEYSEADDYVKGMADGYGYLGYIYLKKGLVEESLNSFYECLKQQELLQDTASIATIVNNLGYVHKILGNTEEAVEHFSRSLRIKEQLNDTLTKDGRASYASTLNNIATIYDDAGDLEKGLQFYRKAYVLRKQNRDTSMMANSLNNLGYVYNKLGKTDSALVFLLESHRYSMLVGDFDAVAYSTENIAGMYLKKQDYKNALKYGNLSMEYSKKLGFPDAIRDAAHVLYLVSKETRDEALALSMYELHIQMRDSIKNESTEKADIKQNLKYDYEKKKALDDAEHEKVLAIEHQQKETQEVIATAAIIVLILVISFLIFIFNRLRISRRQKGIIQLQKNEVEHQRDVINEVHKEITDSINYAKRIQSTILPPMDLIEERFKDAFVYYKPKDVVAGDFYWSKELTVNGEKQLYIAAADCTGHGVPGALVSVVCNNALNRAMREYGCKVPGEILDKSREIVIEEFDRFYDGVKDGMDIALCAINGLKLTYAGANNPLWIVRNGEVMETKATKEPIGKNARYSAFETHEITLEKGDAIYLSSDGFVDQFGGPKGKKFKSKPFKNLLLSIQDRSMKEQQKLINEAFESWKGSLEQVDDVCVVGIRVS